VRGKLNQLHSSVAPLKKKTFYEISFLLIVKLILSKFLLQLSIKAHISLSKSGFANVISCVAAYYILLCGIWVPETRLLEILEQINFRNQPKF